MFFKNDDGAGQREQIPALPLRDIIVFPHMVSQLFVGREKSIAALDDAMSKNKEIFLVAQKNARTNEPTPSEVFEVGTVGTIVQLLRLADGTVKVLVEGRHRAKATRYASTKDFFMVEVEALAETHGDDVEVEALMRSVQSTFESYAKLNKKVQPEVVMSVEGMDDPSKLADTIAANLPTIKLSERYTLLSTLDVKARLERLYQLMQSETEILQVEKKIRARVKKQMERTQKEYYLNEQMQAIQKELGGGERDELKNELAEIERSIAEKALSAEARDKLEKEVKKLKMMHPTSAEATVVRTYIDWVLALPWGHRSEERFDLKEAETVLDEDHFGLEKCKERIVEYLAVQALTGQLKSPILCFVGPPGVGKTSIARSIARSTGREFVRFSLGGVRDEAEIRGHRRTYIGAMPGKLIQNMKKVGTQNPVFLLDEIDKLASDYRGDPASALLEVLDPEQNSSFNDHYLDLDYDLSEVMFITTANTLGGIPLPLRDRLEIIELSSYTELDKLAIAKSFLLPRNQKDCGLEGYPLEVTPAALLELVRYYTREAGVRSLERQVSSLLRKVALRVAKERGAELIQKRVRPKLISPPKSENEPESSDEGVDESTSELTSDASSAGTSNDAAPPPIDFSKEPPLIIDGPDIVKMLGVHKYRDLETNEPDLVGLTHGLSVSDYGGALLDCEVSVVPGKGKLNITGLLEKGMEESAQAAMSYVRSRAALLGLEPDFYQTKDFHLHFPEFVRKDGPSAGVTMATSLVSALTQIPVRSDVAMTGELTLRGRVMPIGGLKEKLLAAHRNKIKTVLVPRENEKDLREVPEVVKAELRIVLIGHMDEVLGEALRLENPDSLFGQRKSPVVVYRENTTEEDEEVETSLPSLGGTPVPEAGERRPIS
jgi:ATP-dependent Lon protease